MASHGLICGYRVDHAGDLATVTPEEVDTALHFEHSLVWLHFDESDEAPRAWIAASDRIPDAAKSILLGTDGHMRTAGSGLAGVVGDLHREFSQRSDKLDVLRFYLDNPCLISTWREPLTAIDKLRQSGHRVLARPGPAAPRAPRQRPGRRPAGAPRHRSPPLHRRPDPPYGRVLPDYLA